MRSLSWESRQACGHGLQIGVPLTLAAEIQHVLESRTGLSASRPWHEESHIRRCFLNNPSGEAGVKPGKVGLAGQEVQTNPWRQCRSCPGSSGDP